MNIIKLGQHVPIDWHGIIAGFGNKDNCLLVHSNAIPTVAVCQHHIGAITNAHVWETNFTTV
jgi:hypothetical protein